MEVMKMKKRILKLYENDVIRYIFWGGCTTLVNLLSFYIMRAMGIPLMSANIISIILAILFAYVTNKIWVFRSYNFRPVYLLKEMASFFSCRILTSVFTYVAMIVMVDGMGIKQDMICKIVVSAISLVLNYICSKLFIFKKKESSK